VKSKSHICLLAGAVLLALAASPGAHATVLMDQIGTDPSFFTGLNAATSENFSDDPTFSISLVDDFTLSGAALLTNVEAATLGFGAFNSYSDLTGFDVNIYSSLAAANSSITGNIYHVTIPEATATVDTPFSGDATSALVILPVTKLLLKGTYYISVLADGSFADDGEVGVYVSTGLSGSTPGGVNSVQDNPGGGFGLTGNTQAGGGDAAYRIGGVLVPEPGTWRMMLAGFAALSGVQILRRRRAV
jgi:hypothetical protein